MVNKKENIGNNGEFSVFFGGKSSIDVELFTKSMNGIRILMQESVKASGYDDDLKLEIKAIKKGSLGIDLISHIMALGSIIDITVAGATIIGYWREIKGHLNGNCAKNIQKSSGNNLIIENQEGDKKKFPADAVKSIFDNPKIDKALVELFEKNDREYVLLKVGETSVKFSRSEFEKMATPISKDNKTTTEDVTVNLLIKRPVLIKGNKASKWVFLMGVVNGKQIEAMVEDNTFLMNVHKGNIKFKAGSAIHCNLKIETETSKEGTIISEKYTVTEVIGDTFEINEIPQGNDSTEEKLL